jgi:bacterioferritin
MRGDERVITLLNQILTAELTTVNQYFIHGRMCENWGYERLWKKLREESMGEMKHADRLIQRVLYLEGVPNLVRCDLGTRALHAQRAEVDPASIGGFARLGEGLGVRHGADPDIDPLEVRPDDRHA